MEKEKIEPGVFLEGYHGVYISQHLCEFAKSRGWDGDVPTDDQIYDDYDLVDDIVAQAMDWLDLNVAEDGYRFSWYEGNIMYWSNEDWELAFN